MKSTNPGIIAKRFCGVGTVTGDMVEQRARELAVINGRSPRHYRHDDYLEAQRELTGSGSEANDEDGYPEDEGRWEGVPVARILASDSDGDRPDAELLFEEGSSEAEHERMVAGARQLR
jgi:hypothetical protein